MKNKNPNPPSRVDALPFPVFGLTWYGSAGNGTGGGGGGGSSSAGTCGCSVIAYCGGGGSAKTGVGNKIVVLLTTSTNATDNNGIDYDGVPSASTTTITTTTQRQIEISTGDALCFGVHAFCPPKDYTQRGASEANNDDKGINMVQLLACVGDEILLYGIPLVKSSSVNSTTQDIGEQEEKKMKKDDVAILLGKTNVGHSYGASVACYSTLLYRINPGKLIHCVAVGCENGTIVVFHLHPTGGNYYEFAKVCECTGHTKAICALSFHPRGGLHQLLSSAKDGTARIFNIDDGSEMCVMQCEVHDPKLASLSPATTTTATTAGSTPSTTDPRMMKRPPQILVRGCAYGDLEGKIIYTVASGKRGPAYLTKWRAVSTPPSENNVQQEQQYPTQYHHHQPQPQPQHIISVTQEYRIQCSSVPISATSLSSDGNLLILGSVEGSVLLYDLSTSKLQKEFKTVHDLPVTCVASRPIPNELYLPGELEEGISFDAISASADNRLGRWTLQNKSRIIAASRSSSMGGRRGYNVSSRKTNPVAAFIVDYFVRLPLVLTLILFALAVWDAMDVCRSEFSLSSLVVGGEGISMAGRCFYREVLWAEESRVSFIPE